MPTSQDLLDQLQRRVDALAYDLSALRRVLLAEQLDRRTPPAPDTPAVQAGDTLKVITDEGNGMAMSAEYAIVSVTRDIAHDHIGPARGDGLTMKLAPTTGPYDQDQDDGSADYRNRKDGVTPDGETGPHDDATKGVTHAMLALAETLHTEADRLKAARLKGDGATGETSRRDDHVRPIRDVLRAYVAGAPIPEHVVEKLRELHDEITGHADRALYDGARVEYPDDAAGVLAGVTLPGVSYTKPDGTRMAWCETCRRHHPFPGHTKPDHVDADDVLRAHRPPPPTPGHERVAQPARRGDALVHPVPRDTDGHPA